MITDTSLVGVDFKNLRDCEHDDADKKAMFSYVCSLTEAGVNYIELDFASLVRLPKPSGSENYIYRIGTPEEFVVANALSFAYCVLPLKFAYIFPRITNCPVILEIDVGDVSEPQSLYNILGLISSEIDLSRFAVIRLTGDFDAQSLPAIFYAYRSRTIIPLDIFPRNNVLTALDTAITAYRLGIDSVSVAFGGDRNYASLEELMIMLASMYKVIVSPEYLEAICKAALFSQMFRHTEVRNNLTLMMSRYSLSAPVILRADYQPDPCPECGKIHHTPTMHIPAVRLPAADAFSDDDAPWNLSARTLSSMGLDGETLNQIVKILESCNVDITWKYKKEN